MSSLSEDDISANKAAQQDELVALYSILGEENFNIISNNEEEIDIFSIVDPSAYTYLLQIGASCSVEAPLEVHMRPIEESEAYFRRISKEENLQPSNPLRTISLSHNLPPIQLHFQLPPTYPSHEPPKIVSIQASWLNRSQCRQIRQQMLSVFSAENVLLFEWSEFLRESVLDFLIQSSPSASSSSSSSISPSTHRQLWLSWPDSSPPPLSCPKHHLPKAMEAHIALSSSINDSTPSPSPSPKPHPTTLVVSSHNAASSASPSPSPSSISPSEENPKAPKKAASYSTPSSAPSISVSISSANDEFLQKYSRDITAYESWRHIQLDAAHAAFKSLQDHQEAEDVRIFSQELHTCGICFTSHVGSSCFRFAVCHHTYCKVCLGGYFTSQIDNADIAGLLCPELKCRAPALPTDVKQLVDEDHFERYEHMMLERSLGEMKDLVWCPRLQCQSGVITEEKSLVAMCPTCSFSFCLECRRTWHGKNPCPDLLRRYRAASDVEKQRMKDKYGAHLEAELDTARFFAANANDMKRCPHCRATIFKNGGCNHMTCSSCRYEWCWLCEGAYSKDHFDKTKGKGCLQFTDWMAREGDEPDPWVWRD